MTPREKLYKVQKGIYTISHLIDKVLSADANVEMAKDVARVAFYAALDLPITIDGYEFKTAISNYLEAMEERKKTRDVQSDLNHLEEIVHHVSHYNF